MTTQNKEPRRKAKKSKSALAGTPNSYKHLYQGSGGQKITGAVDTATSMGTMGKGSETVDWRTEYDYVFKDLRVLFIVSILIFAAMIGAQLILA